MPPKAPVFGGTSMKCKSCEKTVYPMELTTADGENYHKSCFKCHHCKRPLKLGNYAALAGVLYCKPHFTQLFKEKGHYGDNFAAGALPKPGEAPVTSQAADDTPKSATRRLSDSKPSPIAFKFTGTQDKCTICKKTVYLIEKVIVENTIYHKGCFRCSHAGCPLSTSNYASFQGKLYCKPHLTQLFNQRGDFKLVEENNAPASSENSESKPAESAPQKPAEQPAPAKPAESAPQKPAEKPAPAKTPEVEAVTSPAAEKQSTEADTKSSGKPPADTKSSEKPPAEAPSDKPAEASLVKGMEKVGLATVPAVAEEKQPEKGAASIPSQDKEANGEAS